MISRGDLGLNRLFRSPSLFSATYAYRLGVFRQLARNKEVSVNLFWLRKKKIFARPKFVSLLATTLISGLLVSIPAPANAAECNPTSTTASNGDTILTFSTVGTCDWTVPAEATQAQVLIVAGGGGGGDSRDYQTGGGGGGGGYFQANNLAIYGSIAVSVGAGGTGGANSATSNSTSTSRGSAGGDSSFGTLKVGGGGGGNSWNYTLGAAAMSGTGGASYLTGGNGGGARSRPNANINTPTENGGTGGAHSSSGILFLETTLTGTAGAAGNNSNSGDWATGGSGGSIASANRTSSISGSSYVYSHGGTFKWAVGAQTFGSGGDANYLGATDGAGGGAGRQGIVIVRYSQPPAGTSVLSFNANGGTGSDASSVLTTGTAGVVPSSTNIRRAGFEFNGWNTVANGSGNPYALGAAITISANTILYAQWIRIPGPSCAAGVGKGGVQAATLELARGGHGCVGISYKQSNGTYTTVTFNYTGADQSWTSPIGATSLTFFLIGAGGGSSTFSGNGSGGSAGFSIGTYAVSAQTTFNIIVGQGG